MGNQSTIAGYPQSKSVLTLGLAVVEGRAVVVRLRGGRLVMGPGGGFLVDVVEDCVVGASGRRVDEDWARTIATRAKKPMKKS